MNGATQTAGEKVITVSEIRERDSKRFGRIFPGRVVEGHKAEIVIGRMITLHGVIRPGTRYVPTTEGRTGINVRPILYANVFHIGDVATVGGMNLTYMGRVTAITAKTISVVEYPGTYNQKVYRFSIARFDALNWDFDVADASKRNTEWTD